MARTYDADTTFSRWCKYVLVNWFIIASRAAYPFSVPSHYLTLCWLIMSSKLRGTLQWHLNLDAYICARKMNLEMSLAKSRSFCSCLSMFKTQVVCTSLILQAISLCVILAGRWCSGPNWTSSLPPLSTFYQAGHKRPHPKVWQYSGTTSTSWYVSH